MKYQYIKKHFSALKKFLFVFFKQTSYQVTGLAELKEYLVSVWAGLAFAIVGDSVACQWFFWEGVENSDFRLFLEE